KTNLSTAAVRYNLPTYESSGHTIASLEGKFEVKGAITIQTAYGPGAKPNDTSGYGRGTTDADLANGDVTLGFHESCHRADFLAYAHAHPLPEFTVTVGMKVH